MSGLGVHVLSKLYVYVRHEPAVSVSPSNTTVNRGTRHTDKNEVNLLRYASRKAYRRRRNMWTHECLSIARFNGVASINPWDPPASNDNRSSALYRVANRDTASPPSVAPSSRCSEEDRRTTTRKVISSIWTAEYRSFSEPVGCLRRGPSGCTMDAKVTTMASGKPPPTPCTNVFVHF